MCIRDRAAELLERGGDALRQFRFTLGDAASLGMVCGGGVTVQFQYLPAGEQRIIAVLRDLIEADGGNRDTWLLRRIEGEPVSYTHLDVYKRQSPTGTPCCWWIPWRRWRQETTS